MPNRKEGGDGGEVAYNLLRAGVGEALPGVENVDTAATHAWALVHGPQRRHHLRPHRAGEKRHDGAPVDHVAGLQRLALEQRAEGVEVDLVAFDLDRKSTQIDPNHY